MTINCAQTNLIVGCENLTFDKISIPRDLKHIDQKFHSTHLLDYTSGLQQALVLHLGVSTVEDHWSCLTAEEYVVH